MIGIGIDTGGTYTDAVIYDSEAKRILDFTKTRTTGEDLTRCVRTVLGQLDPSLFQQAELIALSTTLATNACLQEKGGRAKCLLIGVDEATDRTLDEVYQKYGFKSREQVICLAGKPENIFRNPEEPDWKYLKERVPEWFRDCDCVAVTQVYPEANGSRFEKCAEELIQSTLPVLVTTGDELPKDVDMIRRGAAAYLNARLIPLVEDFMKAVGIVLREKNQNIPVAIVTSDGSLIPRKAAAKAPVTTLLSGPAASAVGGSIIAEGEEGIVVDMGGTTTDIALVKGGTPILAKDGIAIGNWRTTVKGLKVHTSLLGGDSAVRYENGKLVLTGERVIPLSVLAEKEPHVSEKLKTLAASKRMHTRMLHEFFVLQKMPSVKEIEQKKYTDTEIRICRALEKQALQMEELAERTEQSIYTLHTERLEEEGIILRSGLTPTDMMILKGDMDLYPGDAARAAVQFFTNNLGILPEAIPDLVYREVERKLYCKIAGILLEQQHERAGEKISADLLDRVSGWAFEDAETAYGDKRAWMHLSVQTKMPLIGVGAPTHVFLGKVAKLLGTTAVLHPHAEVLNALGAISGKSITRSEVHVKAVFQGANPDGFSVMDGTDKKHFEHYEDAEAYGIELAVRLVKMRMKESEMEQISEPVIEKKQIRSGGIPDAFFETVITAVLVGKIVR